MNQEFLKNTNLIRYSKDNYEILPIKKIDEIKFYQNHSCTDWFNTYGTKYKDSFSEVILQNHLDDFLIKLLHSEHHTKVLEFENSLFVAINVLKTKGNSFYSEQMYFILSVDFIWSIQEKKEDYFDWIREILNSKKGNINEKKADYLFFLILESFIDNYESTFQELSDYNEQLFSNTEINPTPEFTKLVESRKKEILSFQKATRALRYAVTKLEQLKKEKFKSNYFSEIKEQTNHLMADIESELQELESKLNLLFSIQGYRLNEVMKTLTIFSVIFIPLTFLAGIYGMNFSNMPELNMKYSYFVLLFVMLLISLSLILYFKKRKWF